MKILVGCPTAEAMKPSLVPYIQGLMNFTYKDKDFLIVDNSETDDYSEYIASFDIPVQKDTYFPELKERIVHSRNILRQKVLDGDYDYFLSLEQDVIPPIDVIERLLEHKKDVVSGVYYTVYYFNGEPKVRPLIWKDVPSEPEKMQFMGEEARLGMQNPDVPQLHKIKRCGLGCVLISKKVLEKVKFRNHPQTFDDFQFCGDAINAGFELFADVSIQCQHLKEKKRI